MAFLCAVFAFTACNTSKKTVETSIPKDLKSLDVCRYVLSNQPDIQTIDISRMDMSIQFGGQSFSTRGSLKMIRDSVIILSVQPLAGIEMGRARITKDSIIVIDRFNSRYFAENIKSIAQVSDFNFLQSLFCNQIFQNADNKELSVKNFAFYPYPNGCELRTSNAAYDFNFFVNTNLEKTIVTDKADPYSLTVEYSNFAKTGDIEFPNKLKFVFFDGQRPNRLDISVQKIDFNKIVNANFSIPSKYQKADIQDFKF